jgi:hypothetical protein
MMMLREHGTVPYENHRAVIPMISTMDHAMKGDPRDANGKLLTIWTIQ